MTDRLPARSEIFRLLQENQGVFMIDWETAPSSNDTPFGIGPVTELDEARAYLKLCQATLYEARRNPQNQYAWRGTEIMAQLRRDVLAALSWVWDAQERDVLAVDASKDRR